MHKYHYKTIDPVTRIEGHLGIEVAIDKGLVKEAKASGTLFRGFEIILKGRDPRDASRRGHAARLYVRPAQHP